MYNVIITKTALTRSTLSAQNSVNAVWRPGWAPLGPSKELKRSPRFLSRGLEKMWK